MNRRLIIGLYLLQAIHVYFAFPNHLVLQPTLFSFLAIILGLSPMLFFALRFQQGKAFFFGGVAGAIYLTIPAMMIIQSGRWPLFNWLVWLLIMILALVYYGCLTWMLSLLSRWRRSWFVGAAAVLLTSFEALRLLAAETWGVMPILMINPALALTGWTAWLQMTSIVGLTGPLFLISFLAAWLTWSVFEKLLKWERARDWLQIRLVMQPLNHQQYRWAMVSAGVIGIVMLGLLLWGTHQAQTTAFEQQQADMVVRPALVQTNRDIAKQTVWTYHTQYQAITDMRTLALEAVQQEVDFLIFSPNSFPGVLPESVKLWKDIQSVIREVQTPAIVGLLSVINRHYQYNTWFHLTSQGEVAEYYAKRYLRPFRDYLPMTPMVALIEKMTNSDFGRIKMFALPALKSYVAEETKAGKQEKIFNIYGNPVGIKLDDELLLPRLFREAVSQGAEVIMISNGLQRQDDQLVDAFLLSLARLRAIESRRCLGVVTSMGSAVFIDAVGQVLARSANRQKAILVQSLPLLTMQSLYVRWGELFRLIIFLAAAILIGLIARNYIKMR